MTLSIITITYNAEAVLERTLQSIYGQGNIDFEHWLIDGASTDGTLALAQKYGVKNILSEPDTGIYHAMNKGLAKAAGKYVWFMNAGDQLADSQVLGRLYASMQSGADVYYSDTLMVNDQGQSLGLRSLATPHTLPPNIGWRHFATGMRICHQSFVVKRSLAPMYKLNHRYSADIDWEIRCLKAAKIVERLPFVLSRYLTGGFSVKNHRASLADRYLILQQHFGLLPNVFNHIVILLRALRHRFMPVKKTN
jgi:glycosyltransferase involved in cell wall biosynthesis